MEGGTIAFLAMIGFVAFRLWLSHDKRVMIHRERLAAVEKGIELPPLEHEVRRGNMNVQRILLLAGLTWISVGITVFVVLSAMLANPSHVTEEIPHGMQWIGLAPLFIGISHLIVFFVGRGKEK